MNKGLHAWIAAGMIFGAVACSDNTGPQPRIPAQLQNVAGDALRGTPGFPIPDPVTVRLVDRNGAGVPGYTIDFEVLSGGGTATPATVQTDSAGYASAEWTLGADAGTQQLQATVRDMSLGAVVLTADAEFGRESKLEALTASDLGTAVGECRVAEPIRVRVLDSDGVPVANAPVDFVASGGGRMDPEVATSNEDGVAVSAWTPAADGGTQNVTANLHVPGSQSVSIHANVLPRAANGFAAIGNSLLGPDCAPYIIRGIARPSLEWEPFGDPHFDEVTTDFANIKAWGANTVRIPVNQTYWVPSSAHFVEGYREFVLQTVAQARAAGLNVIFDLHIGDRGETNFDPSTDMPQMPDVNHSLPFWRDVARTFRNDGGVIFELYNEPHDISIDLWRNGGTVPAGPTYAGGPTADAYEAVGMQQLYDAVRAEGAENLVIIGGLHWGYYLDEVATHLIDGYNIAYSAHPYDWPDKQPAVWEEDWGFLAATKPIVVTEFGAYDCDRTSFYTAFLDYAEQKEISWIAWAWWTPPDVSATYSAEERQKEVCLFPSLISDWNATPSASGAIVKQRLLQAAAQ
jgi:aryl-phospho-beta-D-glucosidase BglC (GH1 family)